MIELLSWDSDFFKLKIGKSHIHNLKPNLLVSLFENKTEDKYDLIYLFCDKSTLKCDAIINNCWGMLADIKVTYHKVVDHSILEIPKRIVPYTDPLIDNLLTLALESGHDSRFKKDKRLALHYEDFYTKLIKKSLDGSIAYAVFVYPSQGRVQGFLTVKKKVMKGRLD